MNDTEDLESKDGIWWIVGGSFLSIPVAFLVPSGFLLFLVLGISFTITVFLNGLNKSRHPNGVVGPLGVFIIVTITFSILILLLSLTTDRGLHTNRESASAAKAHNLAIAAFSYSNDNNGIYPSGSTSTEIFQTLYDGKYLTQPGDIYLKPKVQRFFPVKVLYPGDGQIIHIKAENVSWDFVTLNHSGLTGYDPNDLPLLFSDVDTAPAWKAGVNNATITASDPWGTDGITISTLDQQARFIRPSPGHGPTTVPLTSPSFTPAPGATYVTRKP